MKTMPQLTTELTQSQTDLAAAKDRITELEGQLAQLRSEQQAAASQLAQSREAQGAGEKRLAEATVLLAQARQESETGKSKLAEAQRQAQQAGELKARVEAELTAAKKFIAEVAGLFSGLDTADVTPVLRAYVVFVRKLANDQRLAVPAGTRPADLPENAAAAIEGVFAELQAALQKAAAGEKLQAEVLGWAQFLQADFESGNPAAALGAVREAWKKLAGVFGITSSTETLARVQWKAEDAFHAAAQVEVLAAQMGYTRLELLAKALEALVEKNPILNQRIVSCSTCRAANIYPTDSCWACRADLRLREIELKVQHARERLERDFAGVTDWAYCPICKRNVAVNRQAVSVGTEWHVGDDNITLHKVASIEGLPQLPSQPTPLPPAENGSVGVFVRWLRDDETQDGKYDCLVRCPCGQEFLANSGWVAKGGGVRHGDHSFSGIQGLPPRPVPPVILPAVLNLPVIEEGGQGKESGQKRPLFKLPGSGG